MFGISWAEFLVILLVAVVVIPARMWPDVARFLARVITFVRKMIWKITDASEQIRQQIDLEKPIDDILSEESPQKYIIGTFTAMPEARKILVSKTGGK